MKRTFISMFCTVSFGLVGMLVPFIVSGAEPAPKCPDTILYNGKIVTVDKDFRIAQAVAICDGRISAVGSNAEIQALAGTGTEKIDLHEQTVLPGLIDSHSHMEKAGERLVTVPLHEAKTVEEALALIADYAAKAKPGEWITGSGAFRPLSQLKEERFLTRWEIDKVAPDNPVYLPSGHFAMCNTPAMRLAGITKETPNPPDGSGEIRKDPKTGEPDGVLVEAAQSLLERAVPPWSFDLKVSLTREAMRMYNRVGVTSVVVGMVDPESFKVYQNIWANHQATVRAALMYTPTGESQPSAGLDEWERVIRGIGCTSGFGDDWLKVAGIKLMVDGGMTLRTAYLRDAYPDDPNYRGSILIPPEKLNRLVSICNRHDWQVGIHCVGDAAIDMVLDAYEHADKEKSIAGKRFALIHGSLMLPEQMERARKLGCIVTMQDFMWAKAKATVKFIGKERAERALPVRQAVETMGAENVCLGTDFPVNPFNPFVCLYAMVTRKDSQGTVYGAAQAISRETALRLYTASGARYTSEESSKGSIEPGKLADLIVISDDILSCPEEVIKNIQVRCTMVGGKIVYQQQ